MKNANNKILSFFLLIFSLLFIFGGIFVFYFVLISNILVLGTHRAFFDWGYFAAMMLVVLGLLGVLSSFYLFFRKSKK